MPFPFRSGWNWLCARSLKYHLFCVRSFPVLWLILFLFKSQTYDKLWLKWNYLKIKFAIDAENMGQKLFYRFGKSIQQKTANDMPSPMKVLQICKEKKKKNERYHRHNMIKRLRTSSKPLNRLGFAKKCNLNRAFRCVFQPHRNQVSPFNYLLFRVGTKEWDKIKSRTIK